MRRAIRSPLLAIALVILFAGTALATSPTSFAPDSPNPLARGTLSGSVHYNTGEVKFQTKGPVDFVTQRILVGPSGSSGWHSHPGVVLVTVASGTVIRYEEDCSSVVYGAGSAAGSAFTESGDHVGLVRNASPTARSVIYATYLVPAGTTALRIDKPNPGCPVN